MRFRWWGDRVTEKDIARMGGELDRLKLSATVKELVKACIEWDPKFRPKAAVAGSKIENLSDESDHADGPFEDTEASWDKGMKLAQAAIANREEDPSVIVSRWKGGSPWR